MEVIFILVLIVLSAVGVLGWLFYSLKKHEVLAVEETAVPIQDINEVIVSSVNSVHEKAPALKEPEPVKPFDMDLSLADGTLHEYPVREDNDLIQRLKEEVKNTREKAVVQSRNAIEVINKLRDENEALRRNIEHLEKKDLPSGTNAAVAVSIAENEEKLIAFIRSEYEQQLNVLFQEIEVLKKDNEALRSSHSVQAESVSAHSFLNAEAVEALKENMDVLRSDRAKIEARIEELEGDALQSKEKNEFLQYELTKSRAQAIGVERIYDNARKKFEGLARDAYDIEQNNVVLKRQANILEKGLMDFKRLNAELLKREKLNQYELENNQTQLSDLENIYQTFRDRLENAGVTVDPFTRDNS